MGACQDRYLDLMNALDMLATCRGNTNPAGLRVAVLMSIVLHFVPYKIRVSKALGIVKE